MFDSYPRPPHDTGLGLHDSANVYLSPGNAKEHAQAMRQAGLSWYKLLADGTNKVDRARAYVEAGIMPIVRLYRGTPHPNFVPDPNIVAEYVKVGAKYFEFGNEPNLTVEWKGERIPSNAISLIVDQWLRGAELVKRAGGIPLLFALSPGGNYEHRAMYRAIFEELRSRGAISSLLGSALAVHPRPHNNPPDTPVTDQNTVTWNEHRWIAELARHYAGEYIPMFATEHGYSPGSSENREYPPIDAQKWAEYNRELFLRMNPAHPNAAHPALLAVCYWLECHGTAWGQDVAFPDWMERTSRPNDSVWGKTIYTIKPGWDRGAIPITPVPPKPDPVPEPEMTLIARLAREFGGYVRDIRKELPRNANSQFPPMDSRQCKFIAIHHTAAPSNISWEEVARFHIDQRGFAGIGYHFGIQGGMVSYLGDVDTQRAHVYMRNDEAIGIVIAGNYEEQAPSPTDIDRLKRLIKVLDQHYGHAKTLVGHRDMNPGRTLCPGHRLYTLLPSLRTPGQTQTDGQYGVLADKARWNMEEADRKLQEGRYQEALSLLRQAVQWQYQIEAHLKRTGQ